MGIYPIKIAKVHECNYVLFDSYVDCEGRLTHCRLQLTLLVQFSALICIVSKELFVYRMSQKSLHLWSNHHYFSFSFYQRRPLSFSVFREVFIKNLIF